MSFIFRKNATGVLTANNSQPFSHRNPILLHPVSVGFPRSPPESLGTFPEKTGSCFSTTDYFFNISNTNYYFWTSSKGSDFAAQPCLPSVSLLIYPFIFLFLKSGLAAQAGLEPLALQAILLPQCSQHLRLEMLVTTAPCCCFCF